MIISVYNEAKHLKDNLLDILNQNHPNFEVIVIDDASTDDSFKILQHLNETHQHLTILKNDTNLGKKASLTKVIASAKHDYLLFTDGDCKPSSKNWIRNIATQFNANKHLVLGYGAYIYKSSFLNALIRFETALTALQYLGFAHLKIPYMGVGRNLGYSKKLFHNAEGFTSHEHLMSGDDDLFVSQMANSTNTTATLHPESFTYSHSKDDFSSWFKQKRRHITTSNHYSIKHQILLTGFYISNVSFWSFLIFSTMFWQWNDTLLILLGIRFLVVGIVFAQLFKSLREPKLLILFPILEITLLAVQASLFIANIVSKPKTWS